ncbi:hypothetical protein Ddye_004526 [Dipteronia dyeriana]|uniref:Uncharacterized protein n=1 Tax=Dipteronia dyeriana TaxID=168575 RepID=A0AAE0CWB4_9ROSI|nr:hypothetical protein Ddye_004526 [Dipteronia dyeriana]
MAIDGRVNSAVAKKLWNVLRITFFMIRKGLVSKRKLIMDMNLMMKRGKLLRKSLSNLMSHHHHHHHSKHVTRGSFGIQEYEFSCSNSPNPVFFHVSKRKHHHHHHYFPCINTPQVLEEEEEEEIMEPETYYNEPNKAVVLVPKTPEYTFNFRFDGEKHSPMPSPFSVRVSNYSSEDDEIITDGGNGQVDDRAEEFIRNFYEQLRAQSRMQLLQ